MADIPVTISRGKKFLNGATPVVPGYIVGDAPDPNQPTDNPGTFLELTDVNSPTGYVGKNGHIPVVNNETELVLEPLPNGQQDGLISGGIVQWTGTGYAFNVSSALARFQGIFPLQSAFAVRTLTAADATNPRIDLFILQILFDADGIPNGMESAFITGTPAATPAKPQINPQTQIELTQVLVPALSTTPTLTANTVYDQNVEWVGTSSGTGTANFASAVNPKEGSVSVETTDIQNGFYIQFNNGSEIDISTFQTFAFWIDLKAAMPANQNIYVTFLNGSLAPVSNFTLVNLDKNSTVYQFIGIALNSVSFTSNQVQYIRFSFVRSGGSPVFSGYFLDVVKLEGGINPPVQFGTFLTLGDTPSTYSGQGGKSVAVKADESGLEFVTGGGGASTFLALTDTPSTYVAQANKFPRVNGGETALIFDTVSPYDLDQEAATDGQVLTWSTANSRYQPVTPSGGGLTIGTIDSVTKSANGGVISGSSLIYQTADASFPGLVSIGAQTFAGDKTFTGRIIRTGFLTSNSQIQAGALELQSFSINNGWLGENAYFDGAAWRYRAAGQAGLFYFLGNEGQFRFFETGAAGGALPSSGATSVLKLSANGVFAIGAMNATKANYTGAKLLLFTTGNISIGNIIDSGFRLDVTGNSRFTGNIQSSSANGLFWDNTNDRLGIGTQTPAYDLSIVKSATTVQTFIRNTSGGSASDTRIVLANDINTEGGFFLGSSTRTLDADTVLVYANKTLRFMTNNTVASGGTNPIIFQAGGSNASQETMRILGAAGGLQFAEAKNILFGTTTGSKIGTATNQKLAFWNKTPIIQPTTGITGAARVAGGGATITDTDTFGGYTVAQAIAILINTGLTA